MRFSDLDGRSIALWGLGRETRSFVEHARARLPGARVEMLVVEDPAREAAALPGVPIVKARAAVSALGPSDVLVRSPGVSLYRPEIRALSRKGVHVVTATGLWLAERDGRRVIGVTGTKGKSTTATMLAHLIRESGLTVHLAGNIGRSALDLLDASTDDWAVIELSSYQIADLPCGPEVALITNLFKEHTDWHGDEATYRRDKLRLLGLPGVHRCVVPARNGDIEIAAGRCPHMTRFGDVDGWRVAADGLYYRRRLAVPASHLPLRGRHNAENLCAALAGLDAAGITRPPLPESLKDVATLPHRLETVHTQAGIEWVDDSISTTPESTVAAMAAYGERDIILIAGGQDRDQEYAVLGEVAAARNAAVLGLPGTGARLVAAARAAGVPPDRALNVPDMDAAVRAARRLTGPGSVVLLSPAAPSYNSYRNFEERGDHFAALAVRDA